MRTIAIPLLLVAAAACSGSNDNGPPADVAGTYTLTITDGQNGCNIQNFTTNASQTGIKVTFTQNGSDLSATVQGSSGLVLAFATGNTMSGWINGREASLSSTANHTIGNCAFSTTATANMTFVDNQVQGTVVYTDSGNGSSDCGPMQNCSSTQTFTGSR
jgi:hypothetical protein